MMKPDSIVEKRILLSPLNWGMGHVSRCIGLIHQLIEQKNVLIVACNDQQRQIIESYFPDIEYVNHQGYPFEFSGKGHFGYDLLKKGGGLYRRLKNELKETEILVEKFNIDLVLSDHRYGFRTDSVPSIFITHQMNLPVSKAEFLIQKLHVQLIKRFDTCWILDTEQNEYAGELSKQIEGINTEYIGIYSRFMIYSQVKKEQVKSVFIVSGPLIYAQQLVDGRLNNLDHNSVVVIADDQVRIPEGFSRSSGDWKDHDQVILEASNIISRSGYSTIMDAVYLGVPLEMYPTKGQQEQEYLARFHKYGLPIGE